MKCWLSLMQAIQNNCPSQSREAYQICQKANWLFSTRRYWAWSKSCSTTATFSSRTLCAAGQYSCKWYNDKPTNNTKTKEAIYRRKQQRTIWSRNGRKLPICPRRRKCSLWKSWKCFIRRRSWTSSHDQATYSSPSSTIF